CPPAKVERDELDIRVRHAGQVIEAGLRDLLALGECLRALRLTAAREHDLPVVIEEAEVAVPRFKVAGIVHVDRWHLANDFAFIAGNRCLRHSAGSCTHSAVLVSISFVSAKEANRGRPRSLRTTIQSAPNDSTRFSPHPSRPNAPPQ